MSKHPGQFHPLPARLAARPSLARLLATIGPAAALAGGFLLGGATLRAQTFTWVGGGSSTSILSASNWSGGNIPLGFALTLENVNFTATTAQTIQVVPTTSMILHDLTFSGTARPAYDITGTGALVFTGDITAGAGGNITLGSSLNATFKSDGVDNLHTINLTGTTVTVAAALKEAGSMASFVLTGSGTLVLSGNNTFTGSGTLSGGTLSISADNNLGVAPGVLNPSQLTFNGGTLQSTATFALNANRGIALGTGGTFSPAANTTLTIGGSISGSTTLTKAGAGTLVLAGSSLYGNTNISAGELQLASTGSLSTGGNLTLAGGGTFRTFAANQTVRGLIGSSPSSNIIIESGATLASNLPTGESSTYAGQISGAGSLLKSGPGTLILTGDTFISGQTTVSSGVLQLGNGGTTGGILGNISTGNSTTGTGTLVLNRSDATTYPSVLSGNGTVVKDGPSTLTVSGTANTFNGNITINSGTLAITGSNTGPNVIVSVGAGGVFDLQSNLTIGSLFGPGAGSISAGKTLTLNNATGVFNASVSGAGGVTFNAPSTITANQTYTGVTTIKSGTLFLGSGSGGTSGMVAGNISLDLASANSGGVRFNRTDDVTYGGVISGNGNLTKAASGTLTLTGQSTFSGSTTVAAGTLRLGVANALPVATQLTLAANAVLDVLNSQTIAGFLNPGDLTSLIRLATGTTFTVAMPVANTSTTFAGKVEGSGTFAVSGAGNDVVNLTGTVASTVGTSVGTGATLNIASGGSLGGPIALGSGSVLSFTNSGAQTLSNVISGAGGLLSSSGTTTLTGANTFTGGTNINGGKLIVSNTSGSATGSGPVVVNSGGTLGGTGTIGGTLTLNAGSNLSPGNSPGTLTVGPTTLLGGALFTFDVNNTSGTPGANWDLLSVTGGLTISATAANPFIISLVSLTSSNSTGLLANFDPEQTYSWQFLNTTAGITGYSAGAFQYNASQFQNSLAGGFFFVSQSGNSLFLNFAPVPEPSTWALLALGLGAVAVAFRRSQKIARGHLGR